MAPCFNHPPENEEKAEKANKAITGNGRSQWSGMIGKGGENDHCRSLTPVRKPRGLVREDRTNSLLV